MWRTPSTTDVGVKPSQLRSRDGGPPVIGQRMYRGDVNQTVTLGLQALMTAPDGAAGAALSPSFVEALMGLPRGWTVPTASELSATEWSRWLRLMRSELSRLGPDPLDASTTKKESK